MNGASLTFQLTVTDNSGLQSHDTCIVNIIWVNGQPIADAGPDQTVNEGETIFLNGDGSSDQDGGIASYKWSQISGPVVDLSDNTLVQPEFTTPDVNQDTTIIFELTVIDNGGLQATDTCVINISFLNEPPFADAGSDQSIGEGETITLNGSGSYDTEGDIASYKWSQISGIPVTLSDPMVSNPTFVTPAVGPEDAVLVFQLMVTDSNGLQSTDSCTINVAGNDSNIKDTDEDGIPDDQDDFPFDPLEWIDTDQDGTGNNSDTDDDNDTLPDEWEIYYGLNPLVDDAAEDMDEDGVSNLDEYLAHTDPSKPPVDPIDHNNPPSQPELYFPLDESDDVSLVPELETQEFSDPDQGDLHFKTRWQISAESDFSSLVIERETEEKLTAITVPMSILRKGVRYFWRVKFYDNHLSESEWSETFSFTTLIDLSDDEDQNGIPDEQEVDSTVDLDQDKTPDIEQEDILSLSSRALDIKMGIKSLSNAYTIESARVVHPETIADIRHNAYRMPFGLINFRIEVENPGDVASVEVFFSEPAPAGSSWYKYDFFTGFYDYSDNAIFRKDRRSVLITLKDGGYGDDDGIENGVIVDPSGLYVLPEQEESDENSIDNDNDNTRPVITLVGETLVTHSAGSLAIYGSHSVKQ